MRNTSRFDYQWWKARNHWPSVDAHFDDGARSVSRPFFPIKAANTWIIYRNKHIAFDLPDLQDQKLLTLRWHSISEWGREREALSFASKDNQYHIYEWSQPFAKQSTNDARPKIFDTQLTLILLWAYPQYVIIHFGVIYDWWWFSSLCTVFIYFLLHQNIIL